MARIHVGRMTHQHEGGLVVFLIGMRINRWWRPDQWLPTLRAMSPVMRELYDDPDSGFVGARTLVGAWGPTVVQYWRNAEDLYSYADNSDRKHRPAWAEYNRRARAHPGAVGVWHETYEVARAESVYVDAPRMGLAEATGHTVIGRAADRARARLAR